MDFLAERMMAEAAQVRQRDVQQRRRDALAEMVNVVEYVRDMCVEEDGKSRMVDPTDEKDVERFLAAQEGSGVRPLESGEFEARSHVLSGTAGFRCPEEPQDVAGSNALPGLFPPLPSIFTPMHYGTSTAKMGMDAQNRTLAGTQTFFSDFVVPTPLLPCFLAQRTFSSYLFMTTAEAYSLLLDGMTVLRMGRAEPSDDAYDLYLAPGEGARLYRGIPALLSDDMLLGVAEMCKAFEMTRRLQAQISAVGSGTRDEEAVASMDELGRRLVQVQESLEVALFEWMIRYTPEAPGALCTEAYQRDSPLLPLWMRGNSEQGREAVEQGLLHPAYPEPREDGSVAAGVYERQTPAWFRDAWSDVLRDYGEAEAAILADRGTSVPDKFDAIDDLDRTDEALTPPTLPAWVTDELLRGVIVRLASVFYVRERSELDRSARAAADAYVREAAAAPDPDRVRLLTASVYGQFAEYTRRVLRLMERVVLIMVQQAVPRAARRAWRSAYLPVGDAVQGRAVVAGVPDAVLDGADSPHFHLPAPVCAERTGISDVVCDALREIVDASPEARAAAAAVLPRLPAEAAPPHHAGLAETALRAIGVLAATAAVESRDHGAYDRLMDVLRRCRTQITPVLPEYKRLLAIEKAQLLALQQTNERKRECDPDMTDPRDDEDEMED